MITIKLKQLLETIQKLVIDKNTWNNAIVYKIFVLNRNTWYLKILD